MSTPAPSPSMARGNTLGKRVFNSIAEYVEQFGGNKVIEKILIANNGISAVKAIRSIRRWAYEWFGETSVIKLVVMATPEDIHANAEYVRRADAYVEVPGGGNHNNYANVELIVELAERIGADAVFAGWGHASENPRLPDSLDASERDIAFIGPPGSAMRALGDKVASTIVAQSDVAKVPTIPWSGSEVVIEAGTNTDGSPNVHVPEDVYQRACLHNVDEAVRSAAQIGYPVMIKASEGGGGKGIRKVNHEEQMRLAFQQVQAEVPGSPIFLMKLAPNSRHLEVQLLADQYGQVMALHGRDCSVQRRHQKIMEEGPVTVAGPELWRQMEDAAIRLARVVNYVSAGTIEYLYFDNQYYFLELNPRLQVEHPVTEMITGVNIPAAQLNVAMGIPLHRIPDIRRLYDLSPVEDSPIDFGGDRPTPKGHCLAVRITAENPDAGFRPTSGAIQDLSFSGLPNVWGYFSVGASGGLHEFADSQFGHIFSHGIDREEALDNMVMALSDVSIRGDIRTPVEFLMQLLKTDEMKNNTFHNGWLDSLISAKVTADPPERFLAVVSGAMYYAHRHTSDAREEIVNAVARGQGFQSSLLETAFVIDLIYEDQKYHLDIQRIAENTYALSMNGSAVTAEVKPLSDGGLLMSYNERSHVLHGREEVTGLRLMVNSKTCLFPKEIDPTQVLMATPGKLVRWLVQDGDHVVPNTPFAEVEVMKMVMPLLAKDAGTIHHLKSEGAVLQAGDVVASLELDDASNVKTFTLCHEPFPALRPPLFEGTKAHQVAARAHKHLTTMLKGFFPVLAPGSKFKDVATEAANALVTAMSDPRVPLSELTEIMSNISARVPPAFLHQVQGVIASYAAAVDSGNIATFTAPDLARGVKAAVDKQMTAFTSPTSDEAKAFIMSTQPLVNAIKVYMDRSDGPLIHSVSSILKQYLEVEDVFGRGARWEDLQLQLRDMNDADQVYEIANSHFELTKKNILIASVLRAAAGRIDKASEVFQSPLQSISFFTSPEYSTLALQARQMLSMVPPFHVRRQRMRDYLLGLSDQTLDEATRTQRLNDLVEQSLSLEDVLCSMLSDTDNEIAAAALRVLVMRGYCTWDLMEYRSRSDLCTAKLGSTWAFRGNTNQRHATKPKGSRFAMAVVFDNVDQCLKCLPDILEQYAGERKQANANVPQEPGARHVLKVIFTSPKNDGDDDDASRDTGTPPRLEQVFADPAIRAALQDAQLSRVTFVFCRDMAFPLYYTFREHITWKEDTLSRNVDPPLAFQLELDRLSNFDITKVPTTDPNIHVYYGVGRRPEGHRGLPDRRFFVRILVRQGNEFSKMSSSEYIRLEGERLLLMGLDALEAAFELPEYGGRTAHNQIFLHLVPSVRIQPNQIAPLMRGVVSRNGNRLWTLGVRSAEMRILAQHEDMPLAEGGTINQTRLRFITENTSQFVVRTQVFRDRRNRSDTTIRVSEDEDPIINTSERPKMSNPPSPEPSVGDLIWMLPSYDVSAPYPLLTDVQLRRYQAQKYDTPYVYDIPELFAKTLRRVWREHYIALGVNASKGPEDPLQATELYLDDEGKLVEKSRPPGQNNIGMVAWRFHAHTPEYPDGRELIVIANDITFQSGSFGVKEDDLYYLASKLSREAGLPRIYLTANSGARIALANEVRDRFQVQWVQESNPTRGFRHLYVDQEARDELGGAVIADSDEHGHYRITDIVGQKGGLGVENLKASALIAGETSRAYDETFTLSVVLGRSVGIGAYLVRLGQRTIQQEAHPILLTGAAALNKVLGHDVYQSNLQIGGTKIMIPNGVSHLAARSELEAVSQVWQWLSFVPSARGAPLPTLVNTDPVDRLVTFQPTKAAQDPRLLLTGSGPDATGILDSGSFVEALGGWAKTVICGRARLGGVPVGVIIPETRAVETVVPADPATSNSAELSQTQAGQVWYPDSSYKTAQAIQDLNKEGLPLLLFANWRGFSGGMRDMYHEVLKFGSYIVDNLVDYKQPVLVYIVPHGELRGGSWVVLDPSINPDMMEMYADPTARGGILEAAATVEIKYRKRDLISTMHRLDDKCRSLTQELQSATDPTVKADLRRQLDQRQDMLLPVYRQIATRFCDLHDTPGRMKAKGVIREVVPWKHSRVFFYWRLRARLAQEDLISRIRDAAAPTPLSREQALSYIAKWTPRDASSTATSTSNDSRQRSESGATAAESWSADKATVEWIASSGPTIESQIREIRHSFARDRASALLQTDPDALTQALLALKDTMDPQVRSSILDALK